MTVATDQAGRLVIGGGRNYDALIAATAAHASVDELLTFNPRQFDPAPDGIRVIEPSAPSRKTRRPR
jgi:hypothetical protein